MNTSHAGSNMNCSRLQRRRARATSGRCCSAACRLFFKGEIVSRKKPPDCSAAAPNPQFAHRCTDLIQCRIRALRNQSQQFFRVLLQPRSTPPCGLCFGASGITPALQPFNRGTRAQIEALGSFPPRRSRFDCSDHAFPQIIRIRLWHRLGPQKDESMPSDSSISALLGIPPIQLNRNML